jgi:hypothetical protein
MGDPKPQDPPLETVIDDAGLVVRASPARPPWLACDLEVASVAEIVGLLIAARRTGRLDVVDSQGTRSLYFESGEYTGSTSSHVADRLGEILWRSGRISLDQVLIAAEQVKEGKLLGRALIDLGFIEPGSLRLALIDQAQAVFSAACLEETGYAVFTADVFHKNPIRFGVGTKKLVDGALVQSRDLRELSRKLGSLDRVMDAVTPPPAGLLDEKASALLQLVTSARKVEHTGRDLVAKAALGRVDGTRALVALVDKGFVRPRASHAEETLRVKRLCAAINLVISALDDAGFGVGDAVREYLDKPPPHFEEALSGLSLATPLEEKATLEHAQFISGGLPAMAHALQAVLDDACMQAKDTLPPELTTKVMERVKALGA